MPLSSPKRESAEHKDGCILLSMFLFRWWKREVQQFSEGGDASLVKAILTTFLLQWILPGLILLLAVSFCICSAVLLAPRILVW